MPDPTKAVFLSYASQDAEAARKICETLRGAGVKVWFDVEGGLEHGDEWDAKIRRQIKECVLFIPLVSANTQARHEGYFRIEWDLAAERARGIASGVPFILPVVIDDTGEPAALVPDRFRAVQWTRLPGGAVPPDVLTRFLKLWSDRTGATKATAVSALTVATHHPLASAPPATEDKSIAVLPFANMSADAENEYFSDGMTEEIINALVQVPDLWVAARTSVFAFKGKADDLRTIAAKLNVRTVLEGSVRKAGNKIRITAQLINAADGFHLWSEKFDRGLEDIFAVQDEIARMIAEKLKSKLAAGTQQPLVVAPTSDLEAYQLYLQGRFLWNQRGTGLMKGLACFESALARDPNYALAHTGLADAYALLAFYGLVRPRDVREKARAAALRALELAPDLAEAHCASGFITLNFDRDAAAAARVLRRAVELKPTSLAARYWFASALNALGRHDEGIANIEEVLRSEPFSVIGNFHMGWRLAAAGRLEEAIHRLRYAVELDPQFSIAYWLCGYVCLEAGRNDQGLASFQRAVEISNRLPITVAAWSCGLALTGQADAARSLLSELLRRSEKEYVGAFQIAAIYAHLGEESVAVEWLKRAIVDNDLCLAYLHMDVEPGLGRISATTIPSPWLSAPNRVELLKLLKADRPASSADRG